jgi:hypothetical protein
VRADVAFAAFALVFFVFHQAPSTFFGPDGEAAVDVLTPFAVVAASTVLLLSAGPPSRLALLVAGFSAVLYAHGHGAHLSANSIHNSGVENDTVYFWDEHFSHIEAVLGWFGLVAAACLAERADSDLRRPWLAAGALLLGWTFFTSTVEGQTWWLELAATVAFVVWAVRERRPLLVASASAFAFGAVLIGAWALLQGGVPEFSEL